MTRREPGFIDKVAGLIPGYRGYADREARRGADQSLRAHVAQVLDDAKGSLNDLVVTLTRAGRLDDLDDLERLKKRLGTSADTIRHAQYGESGLVDDVVVRAEDLDRVHAFDLDLAGKADQVAAAVRALTPDNCVAQVASALTAAGDLQAAISRRDELFEEVF